jgi:hypothetical protein
MYIDRSQMIAPSAIGGARAKLAPAAPAPPAYRNKGVVIHALPMYERKYRHRLQEDAGPRGYG